MGVVTVSSASRTPLGLSAKFSNRSTVKRPLFAAVKAKKSNGTALVAPQEQIPLPIETVSKNEKKRLGKIKKPSAICNEASSRSLELDFNEAAAKLENIYKLSPETDASDAEHADGVVRKGRRKRRKKGTIEVDKETENITIKPIVRNRARKAKRLSLVKRVELRIQKYEEALTLTRKRKGRMNEKEKIEELVRQFSIANDLGSLDWKTTKIPPVLSSSEHAWLFKLMQPMKALLRVKEHLQKILGREPTESEFAKATNMTVLELRKQMAVCRAARNKLIKHNLRLVLFVMNKYFHSFANGPMFQDLCQAGVKGLITAIDRFEPRKKFRLSTYGLFWIRHSIIRSITISSLIRVSFGLESVRVEIQKAKLELLFKLQREPTEEEIIEKVGISPARYHDVMRASQPVLSLNARHPETQEEYIDGITDTDGDDNHRRQRAILRLALDDVLDSLKPKESLVIRQRYGLDGKGDRTLGEIAGNLKISREMVRKNEVKALMKLKHPARVDYLRRYFF